MWYRLFLIAWLLTGPLFSLPARSYVGPGVGITMLGSIWIIVSFLGMFLAGVLVWPVRSFFKRRKNRQKQSETTDIH